MTAVELALIVFVAAVAFIAGYQSGRASVLQRMPSQSPPGNAPDLDKSPLPGPTTPSRPRAAPPPARAGGTMSEQSDSKASTGAVPPRRSSAPPPAAAGLMDGSADSKKRS